MASERSLVNRILRELNSWPKTRAVKIHGSGQGRVGDPDLWGCSYGKMFLLEMKVPGEKPTPAQLSELRKWKRDGARTGWYDDFKEAIELVRKLQC